MELTVFGVDPGVSGAIAVASYSADTQDLTGVTVCNIPKTAVNKEDGIKSSIDIDGLCKFLRSVQTHPRMVVFMENVHAMPGQGVSSTFKFGEAKGILLGAFASLGAVRYMVPPQTWKSWFNLGKDKKASLELARSLFPQCSIKNHNMAEAILILKYGIETLGSVLVELE